jgi:hypothetical protein
MYIHTHMRDKMRLRLNTKQHQTNHTRLIKGDRTTSKQPVNKMQILFYFLFVWSFAFHSIL